MNKSFLTPERQWGIRVVPGQFPFHVVDVNSGELSCKFPNAEIAICHYFNMERERLNGTDQSGGFKEEVK